MKPKCFLRSLPRGRWAPWLAALMLSSPLHAICEDEDDDGEMSANVKNSACVNGNARSSMEEVGGGGVNVAPMDNVPVDGLGNPLLQRTISGTNAGQFVQGAPFNMPVKPGQEYRTNWTKVPAASTIGSLHTLVEPTNMPKGYHVEINAGDGKGWQAGNSLDLAGGVPTTAAVDHRFRIVRPIREAGKVSDILLTRPKFVELRGGVAGGDTRPGISGVDADGDSYLDVEIPCARFVMPLGGAREDDRPVSAGDLIFHRPLWSSSAFTVNRSFLSYEGVDRTKTGVVVKKDAAFGWLRQIKAPGIFVDIPNINGTKFEIRLYPPTAVTGQNPSGSTLFAPTGSPHAVWSVEQITVSTNGFSYGVRIKETMDSGAVVRSVDLQARRVASTYFETRRVEGADTEFLTNSVIATPPEPISLGGDSSFIGSTMGTAQVRDQNIEVTRSAGLVTVRKSYERFAFVTSRSTGQVGMGEALLYRDDWFGDNATDKLRTEFAFAWNDYYAGQFGTPVGQPYMKYFPDGSWERYLYNANGTLAKVHRPYEGSPAIPWNATDANCVLESFSYAGDPVAPLPGGAPAAMVTFMQFLPATTEIKINGVTVGKTVRSYSSQTVNSEPVLRTSIQEFSNAATHIASQEEIYHETASEELRGLPRSSTSPAGEKFTYSYEMGDFDANSRTFTPSATGMSRRETKIQGTTAAPDGIASKTTRSQRVMCLCGKVFQEAAAVFTGGTTYDPATVTDHYYDANHRKTEVRRDERTLTSTVYNGLTETRTDDEGAVFTVVRDLNGRVTSDAKAGGPTASTVYNGRTATTTIGSLTRIRIADVLGRDASATDTQGRVSTFTYPNAGRDLKITYPGALVIQETRQKGGRLASVTNAAGGGTSIVPRHYSYGVNAADGFQWVRQSQVTANNVRYSKTTKDWLDRNVTRELPAPSGSGVVTRTWTYGTNGLLSKESDSASVNLSPRLLEYNALGQLYREGWDLGGTTGTLDPASTDPITEHDYRFENIGGAWYRVREWRQYQQDGSAVPVTLRTTKVRMSANADGYSSRAIEIDAHGVESVAVQTIDRPNKTVTTVTTRSDRADSSIQIAVNGLVTSRKTSGDSAAETYQYDSLERLWKTTTARTGAVSTRLYNAQGLLHTVTDEALPRTTTYEYYASNHENAGKLLRIVNAENKSKRFEYNDRGQAIREWGDTTWPVEREFDTYGDHYRTKSYRAGSGWTAATWPAGTTGTADTTTYQRTPATGLLQYVEDPLGRETGYTWRDNGQVHVRTWERLVGGNRVTTTYGYDGTGIETSRVYNDGLTPAVSFTPDRAGRTRVLTDASGTRTMAHTTGGLVSSVAITGSGVLSGITVALGHDGYGRHDGTTASVSGMLVYESELAYEADSGRLRTVGLGDPESADYPEAEYLYRPNSNLIGEMLWKKAGTPILGNLRTYDAIDRLDATEHFIGVNVGGTTLVALHDYDYDVLNRRQKTTVADGSFWDYDYNDRGELELADKKTGTTPYPGQQFRQAHDSAGNRTSKQTGGDSSGANRRTFTTPQNAVNQPSSVTTPATFDVIGRAPVAPTVTVNGSTNAPVVSLGDYFRAEVTATNASAAAWTAVAITQGANTSTGNILTAPASVTPSYDLDGNLTNDGLWSYTWDAENRLIKAIRNLVGIPYRELGFAYDGLNRRIQRLVYHAPGAPPVATEKYVHEGSRRILTLDAANQPVQSFIWGLDVSGTQDKAQGVGGLAFIRDHASGDTHFACSDGNGNVTHLVSADSATISATYEYSPHGELLRATGYYASSNPFRFSTRPQDDLTGLLDYGLRQYKPDWGRWLSRDPLGEFDGANPYRFLGNDPINSIDVAGAYEWETWRDVWLNPNTYLETFQDPEYWDQVGQNYKDIGEGVVNGAKSAVDGIKSIPEIAEFIASGDAAEMVDRLLNDPDFRDEMAKQLGDEFCDFYRKLQTQEGFFETYGETAFGILSGAGVLKAIKAFKAAKAAGKFAKGAEEIAEIIPEQKIPFGGCFVAGTMILTAHAELPIETLKVGDRVLASDSANATSWTEVDPATWRKIDLRLVNPESPSETLEVTVLRPLAWMEQSGCRPGAVVPFTLEEIGVSGPAEILRVDPCPDIKTGEGRVILATVTHVNGDVRTLRLTGSQAPIELTGAHRLFSLDRGEWIATRDLREGETLATRQGQAVIESIARKPGLHRVFNIEVETEHCFFVGFAELLTHNTNPCAASDLPQMKGMSKAERDKLLNSEGFTKTKVSNSVAQNETWSHSDGSEVRVHPYGNEATSPYKSGNNAHLHKEDPSGNQLDDRGNINTNPNDTHIGLPNPSDLPQVRNRPHGS